MRIVIATDAWYPQTNGVVTTLNKTGDVLKQQGHEVMYITPEPFKTVAMPTYAEIRLSVFPGAKVCSMLDEFKPDAIHIATEGPIGFAVRSYCLRKKFPFTSSYHTQYPEYIKMRFAIPLWVTYRIFRWFHAPAVRILVPTESQRKRLQAWQFKNVKIWPRGVDTDIFKPIKNEADKCRQPMFIYVGRLAPEKNVEAFLGLDLPGIKMIVGDGPDRVLLSKQYPDAVFTGYQYGQDLARTIAAADVFVFPSRTDTFGLVMLEAMACGVPVAAYPVTGPVDVVINGETGILNTDLGKAAQAAMMLDKVAARRYALNHSWIKSTSHFLNNLAPQEHSH